MSVQIKWIILIFWIYCLPVHTVISQYTSIDNYTGDWKTPASWSPTWTIPQTNINGYDITINGYITLNDSLSFSGSSGNLIINDTLVIKGGLSLGNTNNLTIDDSGILIVRGNLTIDNNTVITINGYLIITGNLDKNGSTNNGSFTSNDNPVKVFIGGTIPSTSINTDPDYPVLNCTTPPTDPYAHSNCSHGDMKDLMNDPIYPFFQSTCATVILKSSDTDNAFCAGTSVTFTAGGGTNYNFRVNDTSMQNGGSTAYTTTTLTNGQFVDVIVTGIDGCLVTSKGIINTVIDLPVPTIAGPTPVCADTAGYVYTTEPGMSNYKWTLLTGGTITAGGGPGNNTVTVTWKTTGVKTVTVNYTNVKGCTATSPAKYNVTVNALPIATASNNGPVCEGNVLNLTGGPSGMKAYAWTGPGGFTSLLQNPSVSDNSNMAMAGVYTLTITDTNRCDNKATTTVVVNALPLVTITSSSSSMCINDSRTLTGSPPGGTFTIIDGPGAITANVLLTTGTGMINLAYSYTNGCTNIATQSIKVKENPVAIPGPDQELKSVFETQMKAELSASDTGEWSLISGTGHISDIHSPTTRVTELSFGENSFLWKVWSGNCIASAEVKITVFDLFIPSVITPNGDGKNDYFKISEIVGLVELFIFNRWGNEEYTNSNYSNDWDGRNNKGVELPNDTYFYVLKFENGTIKKGSVLIKR
jgi:gliding motility-associated-like protein